MKKGIPFQYPSPGAGGQGKLSFKATAVVSSFTAQSSLVFQSDVSSLKLPVYSLQKCSQLKHPPGSKGYPEWKLPLLDEAAQSILLSLIDGMFL